MAEHASRERGSFSPIIGVLILLLGLVLLAWCVLLVTRWLGGTGKMEVLYWVALTGIGGLLVAVGARAAFGLRGARSDRRPGTATRSTVPVGTPGAAPRETLPEPPQDLTAEPSIAADTWAVAVPAAEAECCAAIQRRYGFALPAEYLAMRKAGWCESGQLDFF
ncbi:hypothetical protein ACFL09_03385, partial [Planctomycetota bacterium]